MRHIAVISFSNMTVAQHRIQASGMGAAAAEKPELDGGSKGEKPRGQRPECVPGTGAAYGQLVHLWSP